jgi:peptidyl-Lys metalloendopeptidase
MEITMKTRRTYLKIFILLSILLLAACGRAGQYNDLMNTAWVLISLQGNPPIDGKEITLNFQEENIRGSGGCNTYGGSYTASKDNLNLSDVYWTEMACMEPEGIMEQEQAYFQALNAVTRYTVNGDRLELYDKDGTQILEFATPTSASSSVEDMPVETAAPDLSLDCSLAMDGTYPVGEPVNLRFELRNPSDRPLYVLSWYTPLEGIAGEIFEVTLNGEKLPYQGMLAKRSDPSGEEYITLESGKVTDAEVDLRTGYDLSTPGTYQIQFTIGLQDATDDASLLPRKQDKHQPQPVSCNTVSFRIVAKPESPTPAASAPTSEPPAGFRRYENGPSGVSLWVPESWTIIEPGPHGGTPILQSYPQDKYIGGEPRQPGDTKCGLTIHPPETSVADLINQIKSDPSITILTVEEIVLQSGLPGMRMVIESMGTSLSLITEVNELAVVLTCFGEFEQVDQIAATLGAEK